MKKRGRTWRRTARLVTPLAFVCGTIAVSYFFYRIALVAVPTAVSVDQRMHATAASACNQDEGADLKDPVPLVSKKYQQRVTSQPAGANVIVNPDLTQVNPDSSDPVGYVRGASVPTATYEYLRDASDKQLFLRVINQKDEDVPLWQIDPVPVGNDRTYAYSFLYRSNVPVQVSIEQTKDGKPAYRYVTNLEPSNEWQEFIAAFNNADGASEFRMLLAGQGKGYADVRDFNVRQIPDARLAAGAVSVTFDDGWQSVKDNALPLLDRYHIRTTQYIVSEFADRNMREYMNLDTVSQLKQSGHEIGSHSLLHCNLTRLDKAAAEDNAMKSKARLERRGLGPIHSFAYPLGQYNQATQDSIGQHYTLVRTSDFGYNDRYFDELNIRSMTVHDQTSDSEFQSWVDHAKANNLWLVIVYHRVNESGKYSVTSSQLEHQLRMISTSGLKVLPLGEAAEYARK